MARKSRHTTNHTAGEAQAMFEEVIARVGGSYDAARERRILAVPIDGVRLGDRRNELRKPDSNFYSQEFLEALAVARMLVDMKMDNGVVDVARRDRPDLCVRFSDATEIYVEHTVVAPHDGMPFLRHLEEVNNALRACQEKNENFARFCESGNYTVRLTDPGTSARVEPSVLANEIITFSATQPESETIHKPRGATFPAFSRYAANVFYFTERVSNPIICQEDGGWVDPQPSWVAERVRGALEHKRERAEHFDPALRPLWLLIDIHAERELFPPFVTRLVHDGMDNAELTPYDHVVVMCAGTAPVVFHATQP